MVTKTTINSNFKPTQIEDNGISKSMVTKTTINSNFKSTQIKDIDFHEGDSTPRCEQAPHTISTILKSYGYKRNIVRHDVQSDTRPVIFV